MKNQIWDKDQQNFANVQPIGEAPTGGALNVAIVGQTAGGNASVSIDELGDGVSDDANSRLMTSTYLVDEFGDTARMLGDTLFQGAPVVIDSQHHEIHCGDSYVTSYVKDIPNGGTLDLLVVVPNEAPAYPSQDQKLYHMLVQASSESEAEIVIYEAPTVSANGTAVGVINRNRNSSLTSNLTVFHTPTVTTVGTELERYHWGSGKSSGGAVGRSDEFVLRNNTLYLYRITNFVTTANHATMILNHYVHPGV